VTYQLLYCHIPGRILITDLLVTDVMAEEMDQQFVEYIVKAIVDHPDDVTTERTIDEMGTLISLHVNAEDMGTIIGKEGRTAKALRTLLRVLGAKNNARVNLKIIEPEGSTHLFNQYSEQPGEQTMEIPQSSAVSDALRDIPQDEIA
jgi:predicted RNA-binding protein YlqC (UPF0109 family)